MPTRRCSSCGTTWTSGGTACAFCGNPGVEVAAKGAPPPAVDLDAALDQALGTDDPAPAPAVHDLDAGSEPEPIEPVASPEPEPEPLDQPAPFDSDSGLAQDKPAPVDLDAQLDQALAERPAEPEPEPAAEPEPEPVKPASVPWAPPGTVKPSSYAEDEPAPEPVAATPPAAAPGDADLDQLFADRPVSEEPPPPAPQPEPAPAPPPRPKTAVNTRPPSSVMKAPTSQTPRNPPMSKTTSMPAAVRAERTNRRMVRSLAGLLAVGLAFIACNLVGLFVPQLATSFDSGTEKLRSGLMAVGSPAAVAGIIGGVFVVLAVVMVFLAGLEGKAGFLVPTGLLVVIAGVLGIQPMGHRLTLERTNASFTGEVKSLKDEVALWKGKAGTADETVKARDASLADLQKKLEDQEKAAAAAAETASKEMAAKDEKIRSVVNGRDQLAVTVLDQKAAIADRDKKIAALESAAQEAAAARKKEVDALKKERDALKKEVEELRKK